MKKIFIPIIILVAIMQSGCNKETEVEPAEDYYEFKAQSHMQFRGNALGSDINWIYDNWENGTGAAGGFWFPLGDAQKILQTHWSIYGYGKTDFFSLVAITSPAFCADSSYTFKRSIFNPGLKTFHLINNSIYEGFELSGNTQTGHFKTSNGEQDSSSFEIIKTQELPPYSPLKDTKRLRLWIVVSCNLYDFDGKKIGTIKDGQIISEVELVYIK
jgi:hypothetical protein